MANPIIQRELVSVLRRRRALLLVIGLALTLALLVVLRWPTDARVNMSGQKAQQVLSVFGYGLMAGLILLAPAFPAVSIVREKRAGTLALLLASPLGAWTILLGKLLGVAGYTLLLVVVSLPPAAACYAMGGISFSEQLLPMYLLLALLALQYATLALLISSLANTADAALRAAYGLVLVLAVLTLGPYYLMRGTLTGPLANAADWLRCLSPIAVMMEIWGHGGMGSRGLQSSGGVVGRYALLSVVSIVLGAIWMARRLNSFMLDRPRAAGRVTDERSTGVQVYRRIMYLWFFDPQRRSGLIGPLANPVMVKEFRSRRFGRGNWMMRLIAGCMVVSLALAYFATTAWQRRLEQQESVAVMGAIMVILQVALIVLLTPSLASGLIASERESGGWQLLQMTPLSPLSIMLGKLLSVVWTVALMLVATLPGYAVMILIDNTQQPRVARVLVSLALTAVFTVLTSAAVGSLCRRTATATTAAYTIVIGLCAGTMLFWLGQDAPFSRRLVETVLWVNPLAGALQLIEAPGFADYQLVPMNWYIMGLASLVSLAVLLWQTRRLTKPG